MLIAVVNIWWRLATVDHRSSRCVMFAVESYWLVCRAADDPDRLSSQVSLLLAQGQGLSDENRSGLHKSSLWWFVCLFECGYVYFCLRCMWDIKSLKRSYDLYFNTVPYCIYTVKHLIRFHFDRRGNRGLKLFQLSSGCSTKGQVYTCASTSPVPRLCIIMAYWPSDPSCPSPQMNSSISHKAI